MTLQFWAKLLSYLSFLLLFLIFIMTKLCNYIQTQLTPPALSLKRLTESNKVVHTAGFASLVFIHEFVT